MEALTTSNLILFAAFVVPGFISMCIYGLLQPDDRFSLAESVLEAITFGIVNFAVMFWAISLLRNEEFASSSTVGAYILVVLVFFVAPVIWALLLYAILRILARRGWILRRHKTSWDDYFVRKERCWIIVHLKDGRRIGGWYGKNSYASLYPNSGHLYLEELRSLDESGVFQDKVPRSKGIVLRPEDYQFIEIFQPEE